MNSVTQSWISMQIRSQATWLRLFNPRLSRKQALKQAARLYANEHPQLAPSKDKQPRSKSGGTQYHQLLLERMLRMVESTVEPVRPAAPARMTIREPAVALASAPDAMSAPEPAASPPHPSRSDAAGSSLNEPMLVYTGGGSTAELIPDAEFPPMMQQQDRTTQNWRHSIEQAERIAKERAAHNVVRLDELRQQQAGRLKSSGRYIG